MEPKKSQGRGKNADKGIENVKSYAISMKPSDAEKIKRKFGSLTRAFRKFVIEGIEWK